MEASQIKKLIENKSVSDEDILKVIQEYTADKHDEEGRLIPPTTDELKDIEEVRLFTEKFRPQVAEKFVQEFIEKIDELIAN